MEDELNNLRRPGKKIRELLQAAWQRSQPLEMGPTDRCYMVSPSGVVVVIDLASGVLITVMLMAEVKSWERRRRRDRREKGLRVRWD